MVLLRLHMGFVLVLVIVDGLPFYAKEHASRLRVENEGTSKHVNSSSGLTFDSILDNPELIYRADARVENISHACLESFKGLRRELMDALVDPWLMCARSSTGKVHVTVRQRKRDLRQHSQVLWNPKKQWDVAVAKAKARSAFRQAMPTPAQHIEVVPDPVTQRKHIFTVGPESSGTCFVRQYVAAAFGYDVPKKRHNDLTFFRETTAYHMSMPEGCYCEGVTEVPVVDDVGFTVSDDPLKATGKMDARLDRSKYPTRYILDIVALVKSYRARKEDVTVFQVVRHPEITLISKALRGHCQIDPTSRQEQSLAFNLMLQAKDLPEVQTVCYEEIFVGGAKYLNGKLVKSGIDVTGATFPEIASPSTDGETFVDHGCTDDVKAYIKLCPTSPETKHFIRLCGM